MGQKTNSTIIRLGLKNKTWQSKYIAKNYEETSLHVYQNLKIKEYLNRILNLHGLQIHSCKLQYSKQRLTIMLSYYVNLKAVSLIHNINSKQNWKFQYKKNIRTISHAKKKNNYSFKRHKLIKAIKKTIYKKQFNRYNSFKLSNFSETIIEGVNLFTKQKYDIFITFQNVNKSLSLRLTSFQSQLFREIVLKFRRYSKSFFFKEMVNVMLIVTLKHKSSKLLSDYIASNLSLMKKRHYNFLRIIKQMLTLLINSKFSCIKGLKIIIGGRFNGAPRSRHKIIQIGRIPLQTLEANIDYSKSTSFTPNGTFGIKVWIYEK